jgi:hypothetical protein
LVKKRRSSKDCANAANLRYRPENHCFSPRKTDTWDIWRCWWFITKLSITLTKSFSWSPHRRFHVSTQKTALPAAHKEVVIQFVCQCRATSTALTRRGECGVRTKKPQP